MKSESRNVLKALRDFHFGQTTRLCGGEFSFIRERLRASWIVCAGWYIHKSHLRSVKSEKPESDFKNNGLAS